MPHANIQYSQLAPERRYWVMKNCYEKLFDLIDGGDYKIAFEATYEYKSGKKTKTSSKKIKKNE